MVADAPVDGLSRYVTFFESRSLSDFLCTSRVHTASRFYFYRRTIFILTILRIDLQPWLDNLVRIHSGMAIGLPQQNWTLNSKLRNPFEMHLCIITRWQFLFNSLLPMLNTILHYNIHTPLPSPLPSPSPAHPVGQACWRNGNRPWQ